MAASDSRNEIASIATEEGECNKTQASTINAEETEAEPDIYEIDPDTDTEYEPISKHLEQRGLAKSVSHDLANLFKKSMT